MHSSDGDLAGPAGRNPTPAVLCIGFSPSSFAFELRSRACVARHSPKASFRLCSHSFAFCILHFAIRVHSCFPAHCMSIRARCAENSLGRGHANYLTNYFTVRFRQITVSNSWWFTKKCVLLQAIRGKASPPTASPPARTPSLRFPTLTPDLRCSEERGEK